MGLLNVVLDLHAPLDDIVHLDVLQALDQVLNLHSSLVRLLVVQAVDLVGDALEPSRIGLVGLSLVPVSITCEVLRDFVDELIARFPVLVPNLGLLLHQLTKHCFKLVLELGQAQQELDKEGLVVGLLDGLPVG